MKQVTRRLHFRSPWAIFAVVLIVLLLLLALASCSAKKRATPAVASPSALTTTTAIPSPSMSAAPFVFAHPAMWPFTGQKQVKDWQQNYRSTGSQPWHLDAGQTALSFSNGYLGYTEITHMTSNTTDASGAHIGVGYLTNGSKTATAAVIHLVRFGPDTDSPWEVIGTDDTTFTLTTPGYGAAVRTPMNVGGRINGVDESIRVQVRQPSASRPIGTACCVAAGGSNAPWSTSVPYSGAIDAVLTVAASTGGHIKDVERFTITAVRPR